ncbi:DegV family protein [Desulfuribacillus alkaliarsenatis]|uniref:Fatty acid-binding protein DegV n=1 Tax=Desulfuribacillus alkaliarsenatis TaxID=766136 RepID=A0A1E5G166_9FIRM|nr:DegV family protein [Desulfuribacillus alkaliarsenatis]OEF96633.1 fatty acid-binding protein DegV [Desulfuribacillus alkaliarsenatis]
MATTILIDSCCDLPHTYITENELTVAKFPFVFKGKTYEDDFGNTISYKDFYDGVRNGEMPTTAQINIYQYEETFRSILEKGHDIIYISFSFALSGSYKNAHTAKNNLLEEFSDASIDIIDSRCASIGEGLLCYHAIELLKSGASKDELINWLENNRNRLNHFFTVSDLNHLKRGGRISGAAAAIGTVLNINPMLTVDKEGKLKVVSKIRGRKKSLKALVEMFEERVENPENQTIAICHGDCEEDARKVEELIRSSYNIKDVIINNVGPVIGAHTGPNIVGLCFLGKERA